MALIEPLHGGDDAISVLLVYILYAKWHLQMWISIYQYMTDQIPFSSSLAVCGVILPNKQSEEVERERGGRRQVLTFDP
jgi:hypothetical protein